MSIIQAAGSGEVSTGFYKLLLDQSLKFDDGKNTYLTRTPASAGNRKTFTYSSWVKRGKISADNPTWGITAGTLNNSSNVRTEMRFSSTDTVGIGFNTGSWYESYTNAKFRDTSAWYHFVVAVDMTQSTASDRLKFYVNGELQTFSSYSVPNQNTDLPINTTLQHAIGEYVAGESSASYQFDGYLAEINFIDGTALTADSFGETKNGIWIPKDTSGLTFGTNGFHLTFKDDVVSEGFNAVTYRGNNGSGTTGQSISGLGFEPALIWIGNRTNASTNFVMFDYARGNQEWLETSSTDAGQDSGTYGVQTHDADGWTMGGGSDVNANGEPHVAWCWEAGGEPTATNSAGAGATPTAGSVKIDGSNLGSALAGTIPATRLSANTSKGFSVLTYTGTGSVGTVAHGLGATPKWMLIKNRDTATWFTVYHTSLGATKYIRLNSNVGEQTNSNVFNNTEPTSTVFTVATVNDVNASGDDYVAYVWSEVSGYSKFGSFTGNGGSQAIDVGFEPAFVLLKRTNSSSWGLFDNTRQPANTGLQSVSPNIANGTETTNANMVFSGNTFNDNGYYSDSGQTILYMAFADTRDAAFFKDVSSNGNHFTPVNLDYRDSVPDTPTNNFCTFNQAAIDSSVGVTLSEGNLGVNPDSSGGFEGAVASFTLPRTGKWYWEYRTGQGGSSIYGRPSIITVDEYMTQTSNSGEVTGGSVASNPNGVLFTANDGGKRTNNNDSSHGSAVSAGDIIGNAYNADTGQWFIYINNSIQASGAAISESIKGNLAGKDVYILHERYNGNGVDMYNFGQDSSFSGAKIPQGNGADGEDFFYAPPTGFKSLQLSNLPTPAIADPTAHFDIVTYTGTGSTNSIGGLSFQPDWVWGKRRDTTGNHWLNDAVRGATKGLHSDSTNNQYTDATVMNAFTSDGFTVVSHAISNASSGTYVAWNWKAGSTTPSQTYTVKVVSDSGNKYRFDDFGTSAVTLDLQEGGTYTFDQSDSSNSGHPFRFSTTSDGTHGSGSEYTTGVTTNGTAGQAGAYTRITVASGAPTLYYYCAVHSGMGGQANTNSTFGSTNLKGTIQSTVSANTSAGVSIISYTGTGSAATIGHQLNSAPSMVIIKNRDATDAWRIYHASVSTSNNKYLVFGTNALISGGSDKWNGQPTSTVFGVAGDGSVNRSNEKYIMYAFHSVESFSKVGSYVGNGNANGPFVPLNFRASWIMIKNTTGTGGWEMHDNKRIGFNPADESLDANTSAAEATGNDLDILSNGFKIRNTYGTSNTNGSTYVYLAFAESPFKTTSAR
jgi:hypothetical protein